MFTVCSARDDLMVKISCSNPQTGTWAETVAMDARHKINVHVSTSTTQKLTAHAQSKPQSSKFHTACRQRTWNPVYNCFDERMILVPIDTLFAGDSDFHT